MNDAEATVPTTVFLSAHSWIERIMNRPCARLRGTAIRAVGGALLHHLNEGEVYALLLPTLSMSMWTSRMSTTA